MSAPAGASIRVARLLFLRAGLDAELIKMPWKRCILAVQGDRMDGILGVAGGRADIVYPTHSWNAGAFYVWVRADAPQQAFEGPEQRKGKTIGGVVGYQDLEMVRQVEGIEINTSPDDKTVFRKLRRGTIDGALAAMAVGRNLALQQHPPPRPLHPAWHAAGIYIGLSKANAGLADALDAATLALLRDGTVDRIFLEDLGFTLTEYYRSLGREPYWR